VITNPTPVTSHEESYGGGSLVSRIDSSAVDAGVRYLHEAEGVADGVRSPVAHDQPSSGLTSSAFSVT
jgi:hypothetical protein